MGILNAWNMLSYAMDFGFSLALNELEFGSKMVLY